PFLAGVVPERAGGRELAELVTDHRLGDVDGHVLAPIVDGQRVAHHVRRDGGAAGPRLDDPTLAGPVHGVDLLLEMVVDERALLQAAWHPLPPGAAPTATADDELVGLLAVPARATLGLAPGRDRVTAARALALAATERVVDGVHG